MSKNSSYNQNGRSFFGPLILIALGAFFLLRNFGTLPTPNWAALFQLWPLALVFAGLNLVVQQARRPARGVLSAVVGLTAVFVAVYILFFSEDNALLNRLGIRTAQPELIHETISFQPDDISRAEIELDFDVVGVDIFALEPNEGLISGDISFVGDLIFETKAEEGSASVFLDTNHNGPWQWFGNSGFQEERWQIGLSPRIPLDLRIDIGVGSVNLDLDDLNLTDLDIDAGTGSTILTLPDGEYEIKYDAGLGSTNVTFPDNGRIVADFDGGTGSFNIVIPEDMPARIDISSGLGSVNLDSRFSLVEGERNDDGVWQTDDYDESGDGLELYVDIGTGSLTIRDGQ